MDLKSLIQELESKVVRSEQSMTNQVAQVLKVYAQVAQMTTAAKNSS